MSESNYDSADEYTGLMDGHVAETRADNVGVVGARFKRRSRVTNEEVIFRHYSQADNLIVLCKFVQVFLNMGSRNFGATS